MTPLLITPAARPRRPFPWAFAVAFVVLVVAAGLVGDRRAVPYGLLATAAVLAACGLAVWVEERAYTWGASHAVPVRLALGALLPFAALMAVPFVLGAAAIVTPQRFETLTMIALFCAHLWLWSAALGSLLVIVLDVVVSALIPDFRSRITVVVFALLAAVASAAGTVALGVGKFQLVLASIPSMPFDFGFGKLPAEQVADLRPEVERVVGIIALVGALGIALPALLSACTKLADAVMERLNPLSQAFELLAKGQLVVRVEEKGSVEFLRVNRAFNQMAQSLGEARDLERTYGAYLGAPILERIRAQRGGGELPAQAREATVLFADIRGFTTMSEKLAPQAVLDLLNRYLERAVAVVDGHEGYVNKFIGDAIVVIFNGPLDQPDHAQRGARCALALQREVERLNQAGAFPEVGALKVGVGVASGPLVAGNLGKTRTEYTVIGDTVNLAARLTSHAGAGEVWVNQACARAQQDVQVEPLPELKVKGKQAPVQPFRLLQPAAVDAAPQPALPA